MTAAIGNSTNASHVPPVPVVSPQVKTGSSDSDGDKDGSKVAAVAVAVATSHSTSGHVGRNVNTTA